MFALVCAVLVLSSCGDASGLLAQEQSFAPAADKRLVVYVSHKEEVYRPIIEEFEERTGIWVEVTAGGTNELLQRIKSEKDAPVADVLFGGGVESIAGYRDCFAPYETGETAAIQPRYRSPDRLWTPFSALPEVLIYNTKLVAPGELTGWADLMEPKFRGKIAFGDPSVSGSSFTGLVTLIQALQTGERDRDTVMLRFAQALDYRQLPSSGAVPDAVADGKSLVGITLEETALQRIAAGQDLARVYPVEGTSAVPDATALVKGAPHPENAKAFLDFTVSLDTQAFLAQQFFRRSVRGDVAALPELLPLEEIPLLPYDVPWAGEHHESLLASWGFYMNPDDGERGVDLG
jgi:iron(III) transport system substrate-binding protein